MLMGQHSKSAYQVRIGFVPNLLKKLGPKSTVSDCRSERTIDQTSLFQFSLIQRWRVYDESEKYKYRDLYKRVYEINSLKFYRADRYFRAFIIIW